MAQPLGLGLRTKGLMDTFHKTTHRVIELPNAWLFKIKRTEATEGQPWRHWGVQIQLPKDEYLSDRFVDLAGNWLWNQEDHLIAETGEYAECSYEEMYANVYGRLPDKRRHFRTQELPIYELGKTEPIWMKRTLLVED